jgi:hypothetical protein
MFRIFAFCDKTIYVGSWHPPLSCPCTDHSQLTHALSFIMWCFQKVYCIKNKHSVSLCFSGFFVLLLVEVLFVLEAYRYFTLKIDSDLCASTGLKNFTYECFLLCTHHSTMQKTWYPVHCNHSTSVQCSAHSCYKLSTSTFHEPFVGNVSVQETCTLWGLSYHSRAVEDSGLLRCDVSLGECSAFIVKVSGVQEEEFYFP